MITGIGLVSCLGEGIEAHWAALNRDGGFQPVVDATTLRALAGASDDGAGTGPADPQARRPAADGGVAAHRHLRRRTGARLRRREGQRGPAFAHGDDRGGRRRRARLCGRRRDPVGAAFGRRTGRLAEPASDVRSAAHAVPGAALQPAGRQHLDRAWRGGLVPHLHGRGGSRHRCRPHCLRPHRRWPGRAVPGRRLLQRATARHVAALRDGPGAVEAALRRRLGPTGARWRHGARVRSAASWSSRAANTRRRAAAARWRISPRSDGSQP